MKTEQVNSVDRLNCRVEVPTQPGISDQAITVGRRFILNCQGDWNKSFDLDKAYFLIGEKANSATQPEPTQQTQQPQQPQQNEKYWLKILNAEARSAELLDIEMTAYKSGKLKWPELVLTDGTHLVSLGPQEFQVQSVLSQNSSKPFGYIFPMPLPWPMIYFAMGGVCLALILGFIFYRWRRSIRFVKLMNEVKKHDSSLDIELQFYRGLRALEKKEYPLSELENVFRLYVLRTFKVPALTLSDRQINSFLKRHRKQLKVERQQMQKLLSEFEELRRMVHEPEKEEKQKLLKKIYNFAERIHSLQVDS